MPSNNEQLNKCSAKKFSSLNILQTASPKLGTCGRISDEAIIVSFDRYPRKLSCTKISPKFFPLLDRRIGKA